VSSFDLRCSSRNTSGLLTLKDLSHPVTIHLPRPTTSVALKRPSRGQPVVCQRGVIATYNITCGRGVEATSLQVKNSCLEWFDSLPGENTTAFSHLAAAIAGVMQRECRLHSSPVVPCCTSRVCLLEPDDQDVEYGGL
jgi:hypothetical protein